MQSQYIWHRLLNEGIGLYEEIPVSGQILRHVNEVTSYIQ